MPLASGLGSQFGLSKESTYGTIVTPAKFFEFDSETFGLDQTYFDSVGLRAARTFQPSSRTKKTTRQAGGNVVMDAPNKGFGSILDLMHGLAVTPTQQAATAAYLQTHSVGTSQPNKSATLQVNKPTTQAVDQAFTYPGSILTSAAFAIDTGGSLKTTLGFDSQDEQSSVSTPAGPALATASYPTGLNSWEHITATVTLNSVAVATARSVNLTWTQPYATDRFPLNASALKLKPVPNGFASVEGTIAAEWYDTAAYQLFLSGAMVGLVVDFQGPIIASTYKEQIKFDLAAIQVRGESPNVGGPDLLDTNIPFVARDNASVAPLVVTYMSTDTTL